LRSPLIHSDAKAGILLIIIGLVATLGLIIITVSKPSSGVTFSYPAYDFGFCTYKTAGEVGNCNDSVNRFHSNE